MIEILSEGITINTGLSPGNPEKSSFTSEPPLNIKSEIPPSIQNNPSPSLLYTAFDEDEAMSKIKIQQLRVELKNITKEDKMKRAYAEGLNSMSTPNLAVEQSITGTGIAGKISGAANFITQYAGWMTKQFVRDLKDDEASII